MADQINVDLIVRAISEGFDKISKDLEKVSQSNKKIESSTKNAGMSLTDLKSGLDLAATAARKFFDVAKQGYQLAEMGAQFERLGAAGDDLAASLGSNYDEIINKLDEAAMGTVSSTELMLAANRAMMLGLGADANQLANLMEVAAMRGRAMGISTSQAFSDIVTGIGRMSPMILDNLGIIIDAENRYADYASAHGVAADAIDATAKRQILLNGVLEEGNRMLAEAGGLAADSATKYEQFGAATDNLKTAFGQGLDQTFGGGIEIITGWIDALTDSIKAEHDLVDAAEQGIITMQEANDQVNKMTFTSYDAADATEWLAEKKREYTERTGKATTETEIFTEAQEEMRDEVEKTADALSDEQGFLTGIRDAASRAAQMLKDLDLTIEPELDLKKVTDQILASAAMQQVSEAFGKKLIDKTTYKQMFAEIATTIGGMNFEDVAKQMALFDVQSMFDQMVAGAPGAVPDALQQYIDALRGLSDTDYSAQEQLADSADIMAEKFPEAATGAEDLATGIGNAQQPAQLFSDLVNDQLEPGISDAANATKDWVDYIGQLEDKEVTITINEEHNISYNYSSSGSPGGGGGGGNPPPNCFAPDTPVTMANGEEWPIQDVQRGDHVLAWNEKTLEFGPGVVTGIIHKYAPVRLQFTLDNGAEFVCTPEHPFYQPGADYRGRADFIAANDLQAGDELYTPGADGPVRVRIERITHLGGGPVRNLTVEPQHTYIAAGVLVHNVKAAQGLQNFVVPSGYPNDSYPIWVTSGERVNVETAGQRAAAQAGITHGGGGGGMMVNYNMISDFTTAEFYARAQARAARFARINSYMGG